MHHSLAFTTDSAKGLSYEEIIFLGYFCIIHVGIIDQITRSKRNSLKLSIFYFLR